MSYLSLLKLLGSFFVLYAIVLLIPFSLAFYLEFWANPLYYPQPPATMSFAWTIIICLLLSIPCLGFSWRHKSLLYRRDALLATVTIWMLTPLIGALPLMLSGTLQRFDQAYFESVSGFTTTGASMFEAKRFDQTGNEVAIQKTACNQRLYSYWGNLTPIINPHTGAKLEGYEAVNKAILLWRSLTSWLGGIGIIVVFVAFLPALGVEGKFLFQTEMLGAVKEGLTPRIKQAALMLFKIYMGLTLLQATLLLFTNAQMPFLDALTIAFSTASTSGFLIHANSIGHYQNAFTEGITLLFMWLAGLNLTLYYYLLKGKIYRLFEPEFIFYNLLILFFSLFATWMLVGQPRFSLSGDSLGLYSFTSALQDSFFQMVSAQTTTGMYTINYEAWPEALQMLIIVAMAMGAMSGSTSGGIKLVRIYMLLQIAKNKIKSLFQPKTIRILRIGQKEIDASTATAALSFFFLVVTFFIISIFVYALDHIDFETAVTLSLSMVTNSGFGFRLNGPQGSLAFLSPPVAYFSAFMMTLGRLEFFAMLALFLPTFWKETK
jgi:trk system potassium uptake protein TrkH